MATTKTKLSNGQEVELKELTAGDIFDAQDAAKELHIIKDVGPVFVVNSVVLERLLTLKSIISVDGDEKAGNMKWLRGLSIQDLTILSEVGENFDSATLKEVGERGRDSAAS